MCSLQNGSTKPDLSVVDHVLQLYIEFNLTMAYGINNYLTSRKKKNVSQQFNVERNGTTTEKMYVQKKTECSLDIAMSQ